MAPTAESGLTVAVTGPTGDIGKAFVRALERSRNVKRIIGMARRPFDPAAHGWKRAEYRQGDVLERDSVDALVAGADALTLFEAIPYIQLGERLPGAVRRLFDVVPMLKPVIPDPGVPFQLVHTDDVATALRAGALGRGEPGVYNLAAPGVLTMRD